VPLAAAYIANAIVTFRSFYTIVLNNRCQIGANRSRFHLGLIGFYCVLLRANLLTDLLIESRTDGFVYVRDVGVAGSNPVTPTIDFKDLFRSTIRLGSSLNPPWGPVGVQSQPSLKSSWGPVRIERVAPDACSTAD
jgi:hypothetical protein